MAQTPSLSVAIFLAAQTQSSAREEGTSAHVFRSLSAPAPGEHEEREQVSGPYDIPKAARGTLWGYCSLPTIFIPITRERCKSIRRITRVTFHNISTFCSNGGVYARLGFMGTHETSISALRPIHHVPDWFSRTDAPEFSLPDASL